MSALPTPPSPLPPVRPGAWGRLHALLMPDYNARASLYWWGVVVAGGAVLGACLWSLGRLPWQAWAQVAAKVASSIQQSVMARVRVRMGEDLRVCPWTGGLVFL